MGWWESEEGNVLLGDGPADTLSDALQESAKALGRKPSVEEFLSNTVAALRINPTAITQDFQEPPAQLRAKLTDGRILSSASGSPNPSLVRILYQAFEDITAAYQDMEDHRRPYLRELLATAAFILRPEDQDFVSVPGGEGVDHIEVAKAD